MPMFRVWDELNGDETEATTIVVHAGEGGAEQAALRYAEADADGWTDGLYHGKSPQPISVRCPDGRLRRFEVSAEMVPSWHAAEVTT